MLVFIPSILWLHKLCVEAGTSPSNLVAGAGPPPRRSSLPEENRTRPRSVNLHVASGAVCILGVLIMLWTSRLKRADVMRHAVARQAQLIDRAIPQQTWIRRSVWRMAGSAPFGFYRSVFICEWPLFVRVTLHARGIATGRQSGLLQFKSAVRIMAITAAHGAFQNFMMERRRKCRLDLAVTTHAKLRVIVFQQFNRREARFFRV